MSFTDSHGNAINAPDGKAVAWRVSAYAVIEKNGKFLMVESGSGQWIFPGGGVEESETLAEAVMRESLEETGYSIEVSDSRPCYVREQQFYHTREEAFYHSIQLFYKAELTNEDPNFAAITDRDKTRSVKWINLASVDLANIHSTIHELVQKLTK